MGNGITAAEMKKRKDVYSPKEIADQEAMEAGNIGNVGKIRKEGDIPVEKPVKPKVEIPKVVAPKPAPTVAPPLSPKEGMKNALTAQQEKDAKAAEEMQAKRKIAKDAKERDEKTAKKAKEDAEEDERMKNPFYKHKKDLENAEKEMDKK